MTSRKWMLIMGIAVPVALLAVIWVAFGVRFLAEPLIPIATVLLCCTTAGFLLTSNTSRTSAGTDSWLASIGVRSTFGLIAIGVALLSLLVAAARLDTLAIIFDILSALAALVAFGVSAMVATHTDEVIAEKNFRSAHLGWQDSLEQIATTAPNDEIRATVESLADNARYLARDAQRPSTPTNDAISALVEELGKAASSGDGKVVSSTAAALENKFAQRESELAAARRKA